MVVAAVRERPPRRRVGVTYEFELGGDGFLTVTELADRRPGEVFITWAKQGSTLQGLCDALGISISLGLQYGVPLGDYTARLTGMRFEPAGFTGDPQVPQATSLVDYLFRRLDLHCSSPKARRTGNGALSSGLAARPPRAEPLAVSAVRSGWTRPSSRTAAIMPTERAVRSCNGARS